MRPLRLVFRSQYAPLIVVHHKGIQIDTLFTAQKVFCMNRTRQKYPCGHSLVECRIVIGGGTQLRLVAENTPTAAFITRRE
jgi:hypothetical protein